MQRWRPARTAPLAQPYCLDNGFTIGNRFCILPMEGWDGTADGRPTELTTRRWKNFGLSGAKLIWGGEAVAVQPDARANPDSVDDQPGNGGRPGDAARDVGEGARIERGQQR